MSFRLVPFLGLILSLLVPALHAQQGPPRDNPYDVIGKVFSPFWSVLLADTKSPNKACTMTIEMVEVSGRLPKQMAGASLQAAVQFPDKVKLQAPVLGEEITVCRNGDKVWAYPGAKVEFLLKRFKGKPAANQEKKHSPLPSDYTAAGDFSSRALYRGSPGRRRNSEFKWGRLSRNQRRPHAGTGQGREGRGISRQDVGRHPDTPRVESKLPSPTLLRLPRSRTCDFLRRCPPPPGSHRRMSPTFTGLTPKCWMRFSLSS